MFSLTDRARQHLDTGEGTYRLLYQRDAANLTAVEQSIARIGEAGATVDELDTLKQAIRWANSLRDEQLAAITAFDGGEKRKARAILLARSTNASSIAPDLAGRLYLTDLRRNAVVEACSWLDPRQSRSEFAPAACWALRRGLPHRPMGKSIDVPRDHLDVEGELTVDTLCDVDHFKRFNDDFGHDAGDAVLRAVGAVLGAAVRDKELVFRYGGEEFLILLPGCDTDQAVTRAQHIREQIAGIDLVHQYQKLRSVAVSVGVATTPTHCSVDRLMQTADALPRAKTNGRDRIEVVMVRTDRSTARTISA